MIPWMGGGWLWPRDTRALQSDWSRPGSRYHERLGCRYHGGGDEEMKGEWADVEPISTADDDGPPSPKPYTAAAVSETGNENGLRSTSTTGNSALTCDIATSKYRDVLPPQWAFYEVVTAFISPAHSPAQRTVTCSAPLPHVVDFALKLINQWRGKKPKSGARGKLNRIAWLPENNIAAATAKFVTVNNHLLVERAQRRASPRRRFVAADSP